MSVLFPPYLFSLPNHIPLPFLLCPLPGEWGGHLRDDRGDGADSEAAEVPCTAASYPISVHHLLTQKLPFPSAKPCLFCGSTVLTNAHRSFSKAKPALLSNSPALSPPLDVMSYNNESSISKRRNQPLCRIRGTREAE